MSTLRVHDRPRDAASRGFTLMEVLVTVVILGIAVISATWAMNTTARAKEVLSEESAPAALLAKEVYELAQACPREPSGTTGATTFADVLALDSLHGASFSPAIMADGSTATGMTAWSQHSTLSVYDLADLSTPTADDPALGIPEGDPKLYRLNVVVQEAGEVVESFDWWITP